MKIYVNVKGIKELEKEIGRMKELVMAELEKGTQDAARIVAAAVVSATPHQSFKDAVATKPLPRKTNYPATTLVGLVHARAPHAHLVEFGTGPRYLSNGKHVGSMPANPFFRWSVDASRNAVREVIKQSAANALKKAGK